MSSEYLSNVRRLRPMVHTITNYVTANDCANLLLAAGASPIMADAPEETAQIAAMADAVVLNLGTLSTSRKEAMLLAGKAASAADKPIVLDPVGVGASGFRRETAGLLLREAEPTVIRGNRSEIRALRTGETGERGVDTADLPEGDGENARLLAKQTGAVVLQTGETDLVTDGEQVLRVQGGSDMLCLVTGAGCMLSALTGAFLAANPDRPLLAAAAAAETMSGDHERLRRDRPKAAADRRGERQLSHPAHRRHVQSDAGDFQKMETGSMSNCKPEWMRLYAVTDRAWVGEQTLYEQVECALRGGVTCVQLREKHLDFDAFLAEARELKTLCQRYGVPLIINDSVEIARLSDADGVHVGQSDMQAKDVRDLLGPDKIIGVTAKTVEQALLAQEMGADYLGTGAFFVTDTKKDALPITHEMARAITAAVDIPVTGIGGITPGNLDTLEGLGLDGVALVSAIFSAPDIEQRCRQLRTRWMFPEN